MTDRVAYVLAACAAHRFAPLILRRSQDPKAIEAADQLEAAGKDLPWERGAKIPRTTLTHFVEAHGKAEATFERLRGDASKQAPSAEEIAAGLLLTADNATASIADRARPDSHDIPPAYRDFADVPLTLAPLYALAAGVAPKVVEQTTQTCFGALGEAQHHPEMLVVFHPMAPKPRKR